MRKLFVVVGALAALGGLATIARAEVVQTFSVAVPPAKAGKPIAFNVNETTSETLKNPDGTDVQPPPLKQQIIRVNKGGKFEAKNFPRCKKQTLIDTTKCPKSSDIGGGDATAVALPIVPLVKAPLELYNGEKQNGKDTVYVYAVPDIGPNLLTIGEVAKSPQGPYDYKLDFKIDDIQTLPGAPNASVTSVVTQTPIKKKTIRKKGKKKTVALITAPKTCTGKWVGQGEFHYRPNDGGAEIVKTLESSVNCSK